MTIVAILNQKGGSGKTTLATNLASAFALSQKRTLLVDTDPQGSAREWAAAAGEDGALIPVIGVDRPPIDKNIHAVGEGYDWIIIDGAPSIEVLSASAIKAGDIILIPVQPSPYDIWATADLVTAIQSRREITDGQPKAAFVVTRAIAGTKLSNDVGDALKDYSFPIFTSRTHQRVIYPNTAAQGISVFENGEENNPAADEIKAIQHELEVFSQ